MNKKILACLIALMPLSQSIISQTLDRNIPQSISEVTEDRTTYIYDQSGGMTFLSNKSNILPIDISDYATTMELPSIGYNCRYTVPDSIKLERALLPFFSAKETQEIIDRRINHYGVSIYLMLFIDMDTWMVRELIFYFSGRWDKELLPISKLVEIEQAVKKEKIELSKNTKTPCFIDTKGKYYCSDYHLEFDLIKQYHEEAMEGGQE